MIVDLNDRFNALQAAFRSHSYPSARERIASLKKIKQLLQDHAEELAAAVTKDFGCRPVEETMYLEIFPTLRAIDYCIHHLKRWMKHRKRHVSWLLWPARAYLAPQPLGVVGVISPWNYPLYLALVPAIYAMAAGNRVMIKMSEASPNTGECLERLLQTEFKDILVAVNGNVEVATRFSALPFDHLFFTGSPNVGKLVMAAAAQHLTPVTLELGGKSPAVLSKSMNHAYFKRLFMGKLFNGGQTCVAPDYLFIPQGWDGIVEEQLRSFIETAFPDFPNNQQYASIISEHHVQRLLAVVEDAKAQGARVVTVGEGDVSQKKLPFYLIFNVNDDMRVMQEELFGPILPVMTYQNINQTVDYINSKPHPLALYYFGSDSSEQKLFERHTLSGALTINETVLHVAVDDLPFGGVGHSGMGHTHAEEGFNTFSKLKPVMIQRRLSPAEMMYPPYGRLLQLMLRWIGGIKFKSRN